MVCLVTGLLSCILDSDFLRLVWMASSLALSLRGGFNLAEAWAWFLLLFLAGAGVVELPWLF